MPFCRTQHFLPLSMTTNFTTWIREFLTWGGEVGVQPCLSPPILPVLPAANRAPPLKLHCWGQPRTVGLSLIYFLQRAKFFFFGKGSQKWPKNGAFEFFLGGGFLLQYFSRGVFNPAGFGYFASAREPSGWFSPGSSPAASWTGPQGTFSQPANGTRRSF